MSTMSTIALTLFKGRCTLLGLSGSQNVSPLKEMSRALSMVQWLHDGRISKHRGRHKQCWRSLGATASTQLTCQRLRSRSLVEVSGNEAAGFLQGLVTNDMEQFETVPGLTAISAMMLNPQGRVLYDLIIYRVSKQEPCFLLECDQLVTSQLIAFIKKFRIRKKVSIRDVDDELQVWAAFPQDPSNHSTLMTDHLFMSTTVDCTDPRIAEFGRRILTTQDVADGCGGQNEDYYHRRRYQIGLSEGVQDLPPGECFPLESNAIFLNAVSLSKGCYLGQELTARVHHTGVIRKRLMPIFITHGAETITSDMIVENINGKKCGKLRASIGAEGLALLRVTDVIHKGPLVVNSDSGEMMASLVPHIPYWWHPDSDVLLRSCLKIEQK